MALIGDKKMNEMQLQLLKIVRFTKMGKGYQEYEEHPDTLKESIVKQ